MAIVFLEITLKNGLFEKTNGVNVCEFSETCVNANGWECFIKEDGRIVCRVVKGKEELRYTILKSGYSRMTYQKDDEPIKTIKEGYVISRGESINNGVIFLSDGEIKELHTFFRSEALHKFHLEYGIARIKKVDPNIQYFVKNAHCRRENENDEINSGVFSELLTDGKANKIAEIWTDTEKLNEKFPGCDVSELEEMIEIEGATWVIQHVRRWRGDEVKEYRILYSRVDFNELNIPEEFKVMKI